MFKREKVHSMGFTWDSWNGLHFSKSTMYRLKWFPFITWIDHYQQKLHPTDHPDYKKFIRECNDKLNGKL